jgi:predicted Fe-S protein YdhL (DUF1289 family)
MMRVRKERGRWYVYRNTGRAHVHTADFGTFRKALNYALTYDHNPW